MAKPRVFISSTFYDLVQVRADLERFVRDLGFEPVLHERGSIPYGSHDKLEEYAYQEVSLSDLLVFIVGGRYGSASQYPPYSISQRELRQALELGKPVHIFVEKGVHSEFRTYRLNKDNDGIAYSFVDDVRVFQFLEELYALPNNNPIAPFEVTADITRYLKEQWAGLYQRFLQEQRLRREYTVLHDMQATAKTLNQLVTFLTEERRNKDQAIRDILLSNHPAFDSMRRMIGAPYRLYFGNRVEMVEYLNARGWEQLSEEEWDDPEYEEWMHDVPGVADKRWLLRFWSDIFDDSGKVRLMTAEEWQDSWISRREIELPSQVRDVDPDEIPF